MASVRFSRTKLSVHILTMVRSLPSEDQIFKKVELQALEADLKEELKNQWLFDLLSSVNNDCSFLSDRDYNRYKNFCTEELNSSSDDIKQETIFYKLQLEKLNQTNKLLEQKLASTPDYKLTEGNEEGNVLIPIAATIKPLLTQVNQQIFNESQEKIVINLADLILAQLTSHFSKLRSFSRENLLDELSLLSKEDTKEKILNCFKQKYVINLMDIKAKLGKIKTIVDNVLFNYKRDLCWKKGLSTLLKEISSNLVLNLKMEEKWKENEAQNDEKKFQELLEIVSQINRKQSLSNDKLKEAMDDVKVKMDCLIKS